MPALPAISLHDLRFAWNPGEPPLLDLPELTLARGERLFLHGPSGCGKSTLLSLITGIALPQSGLVSLLGTVLNELGGSARDQFRADHIGYVFQQFNLLPYLNILDNVMLSCRFSAVRRQRIGNVPEEAMRLLERLGLATVALSNRLVAELSVGQQQRVALARALIGAPEILIADEPTSALDSELRLSFIDLMLSCADQSGTSVVLVSHDPALAKHFDRQLSLPKINRQSGVMADV